MIDVKSRGSGYYRVYVDDVEISQHITEREAEGKAIEEAINLAFDNPSARVHYAHDYEVDVTINAKDITLKAISGGALTQPDSEPDPIAGLFVDEGSVIASSTRLSNQIQILGVDSFASVTIEVSGDGGYRLNGGLLTTAPGIGTLGDLIALEHQANPTAGQQSNTTLTLDGTVSDTFTSTTVASSQVIAFPGAVGMGGLSTGGRDPAADVYVVTSLGDTAPTTGGVPGEFRYGCEQTGPRFVVFEVAGNIVLEDEIEITNDYLTIAGQTSPGGVCISGWPFDVKNSKHHTIRYMRFRRGAHRPAADPQTAGESVFVDSVNNIIFDHCSMSYGTDETIQVTKQVHGSTFQSCIFSHPIRNTPGGEAEHALTFNMSSKFAQGEFTQKPEVSFYKNFFSQARGRHPQIKGECIADFVNNVMYHGFAKSTPSWEKGSGGGWDDNRLPIGNMIGNFYQPRTSDLDNDNYCRFSMFSNMSGEPPVGAGGRIYMLDNRGTGRLEGTEPQWDIYYANDLLVSTSWQSLSRVDMAVEATTEGVPTPYDIDMSGSRVESQNNAMAIAAQAGAIYPVRDSHDQQMVDDFDFTGYYWNNDNDYAAPNLKGAWLETPPAFPSEYPILTQGAVPTDTNQDGIPDSFDLAHGFNSSGAGQINPFATVKAADVSARSIDAQHVGYLWIEARINELVE